MSGLVVGLDQGTSSTRCVVLDAELAERGAASVAVPPSFPAPGWVEQDPEAIVRSAVDAVGRALRAAGAAPGDVAAVGIANQTETFVVWERATGRAIHPAIVWQDRRTDAACAALRADGRAGMVRERTGLELDATFPATKLGWVLDHVEGARAAAEAGRLAYGDVASWLLARLAGVHVCDAGNASRSLLLALGAPDWDGELLELFGIPRPLLPRVVDSDAVEALAAIGPDAALPVRAAVGDQQASLFGLRCWEAGRAKVTLGTGAFLLVHAGETPPRPPDGVLASCAWRRSGETSYALEGFVPTAGAAADWFARVGALPAAAELDALLRERDGGRNPGLAAGRHAAVGPRPAGDAGLVCVPAFQGFGTPGWDAGARGAVFGLDLATTRADLARAVVDGIVHQVADALDAMGAAVAPGSLRLDGGLARSDWIAQRLADLAGVRVERTSRPDSTALGAATLAGLAAGVWSAPSEVPEIPVDLVAEPGLPPGDRAALRERWAEARELAARWRS